eukprot:scaffold4940_cov163-Amphora_coffeaeformis.AAC.2
MPRTSTGAKTSERDDEDTCKDGTKKGFSSLFSPPSILFYSDARANSLIQNHGECNKEEFYQGKESKGKNHRARSKVIYRISHPKHLAATHTHPTILFDYPGEQ